MQKRRFNIILCVVSLSVGGILYIIFRPTTYIGCFFDGVPIVKNLQSYFSALGCGFIKYYFPDFLWSFSLCCGLISLFELSNSVVLYCGLTTFACSVTWELLQHIGVFNGVADFFDIAMYLIAVITAVTLNFIRSNLL